MSLLIGKDLGRVSEVRLCCDIPEGNSENAFWSETRVP